MQLQNTGISKAGLANSPGIPCEVLVPEPQLASTAPLPVHETCIPLIPAVPQGVCVDTAHEAASGVMLLCSRGDKTHVQPDG